MAIRDLDELSSRLPDTARMMLDVGERILTNFGPAARESGDPVALMGALDDAGFTLALVPESMGGLGLPWVAAGALFEMLGRYAVPCPMVEAMLGVRILADAGVPPSTGRVALATESLQADLTAGDPSVSGTLLGVPWARFAEVVLMPCRLGGDSGIGLATVGQAFIQKKSNVAAEARDDLTFDAASLAFIRTPSFTPVDALAFGAAARSAQMAGALDALLALCLEYSGVREQFGRPLGGFQVIQHALAQLGALASAARAAATSAFQALDEAAKLVADARPVPVSTLLPLMAAKTYCGEASGTGAAIAHQIFGAIGFTSEHVLHRYTTRLWSWRDEFGSDAFWARRMGMRLVDSGAERFWAEMTAPILPLELELPA